MLRRHLTALHSRQDGAVLVLVAVLMVAMLGLAAFVIDVGHWYQVHRQAQAAADAAALAGAQDLPGSATTASSDATAYVNKNISGATTSVTTPYQSSSSEIKVSVSVSSPSFFGKLLGISSATISASAAAAATPTGSPAAIFSYDSNCSDESMVVNGGNDTVTGTTVSNGSFFQDSNDSTFATTTYGGPNKCSYVGNGSGNTYAGKSTPTSSSTLAPWPDDYATSPPACTYSASSYTFQNDNGATIPAGVYCASGQITIDGNDLSGNVTFIASSFNLNGTGENFTPYTQNLLFYQTGSNALDINGNDFVAIGTVFAPTASVVLNGNGGTVSGFIEALDVTITANGITFDGTGPASGASAPELIQ